MKLKIGLRGNSRDQSETILKQVLADESLLYAATQDYCQNARGPHLDGLRRLFNAQYHQIGRWLELIVARTGAVGSTARGGLSRLARIARISAPARAGLAIRTMTAELHALHEGLAKRLRRDVAICSRRLRESRTAEFLRELLHFHDTTAGLLRSLLEGPRKGCN